VDLTAGEWEALDALRPGSAASRARLADAEFRGLVAQAAEKLRIASVRGDAEPVPRLSPEERLRVADILRRHWPARPG
jgi:hypothetical protein